MQNTGPNPATTFPLANYDPIVGAYSVVTKDVPPYSIVAGNPAKEIRRRFSDAEIERLLELRWWDWPMEKITANVHLLTGNSLSALIS